MIMGPSNYHKNGVIEGIYQFLSHSMWTQLSYFCKSYVPFGGKLLIFCSGIKHKAFNEANPLVQIFYISLLTPCIVGFLMYGMPYIPRDSFHNILIPIVIINSYYFFYKASTVDPGKITSNNYKQYIGLFPYDNVIFSPSECSTCKIPKPARSKHCSFCKMCVSRQDHHCVWINSCVGHNNQRFFLLYILSVFIITSYGAYLTSSIFWQIIHEGNLLSLSYIDENKERVKMDLKMCFLVIFYTLIKVGSY